MKECLLPIFLLLTSCSGMPQLYQAADDIVTDGVLHVRIDKEAFQKNTDVKVDVAITHSAE